MYVPQQNPGNSFIQVCRRVWRLTRKLVSEHRWHFFARFLYGANVHPNLDSRRAEEKMGGETSQLALARCVMRVLLGRERSRGRTIEKWRVKTTFCSTYKVHCYGWTVRHFSLPFGSGHLYTIFKLSVVNNRIIVSQIKVNICEIK